MENPRSGRGEQGECIEPGEVFRRLASLAVVHGTISETIGVGRSWTFILEDIPPLSLGDSNWRVAYTSAQEAEDGVQGDMLEVEIHDSEIVKSVSFFQDQETKEFTSMVEYKAAEGTAPNLPEDEASVARRKAVDSILRGETPDEEMMQLLVDRIRFYLAANIEPSAEDLVSISELIGRLEAWFRP